VLVQIGGDHAAAFPDGFGQLRGLASTTRADIEHALTGLCIEQEPNELSAFFLNRENALGVSGQLTRIARAAHAQAEGREASRCNGGMRLRFDNGVPQCLAVGVCPNAKIDRGRFEVDTEQAVRVLGADRVDERVAEPGRYAHRIGRLGIGRPLKGHLAKDRVHEAGYPFAALVGRELNGIVHDGVRRHSLQMKELKRAAEKYRTDPVVHLDGPPGVAPHGGFELGHDAQRSVDDLSRERRIGSAERASLELGVEGGRCPCLVVQHSIEHVRRDLSRRSYHAGKLTPLDVAGTEIGGDAEGVIA